MRQDARRYNEAAREREAKQVVRPTKPGQIPRDAHAVAIGPDLNRRVKRPLMLYGTNGLPLQGAIGISADNAASINARQAALRVDLFDGEPVNEKWREVFARKRARRGSETSGTGRGLSLKNETSGTCY